MSLQGKTAFVTGGASGIGAALSRELASRGAHVVVADVDADAAIPIAAEIGGSAVALDVSDADTVERAAEKVWTEKGGVDLVFANAGVMTSAPLLKGDAAAFDWIFGVNLRGVWATCKAFANRMIQTGAEGRLVITGSEHSLGRQHLGAGFYTASKHAVLGLADVLRGELPETIGLSVFCPGLVQSRLQEAGRFGVVPEAPPEVQAIASEVMRRGMPAEEAARRAVDGALRGDFLIVTHPNAYAAAERRFEEIKEAFDTQAPVKGDVSKYDVDTVVGAVLKDLGASSE